MKIYFVVVVVVVIINFPLNICSCLPFVFRLLCFSFSSFVSIQHLLPFLFSFLFFFCFFLLGWIAGYTVGWWRRQRTMTTKAITMMMMMMMIAVVDIAWCVSFVRSLVEWLFSRCAAVFQRMQVFFCLYCFCFYPLLLSHTYFFFETGSCIVKQKNKITKTTATARKVK